MPGSLATGQLLDERYALEEPLDEDALGTTWRAHDRGLGRTVFLREVLYPDDVFAQEPAKLKQALMAARLAIRLDHAGAVHVYDAFVDGDRLMMVTEAVWARSLASAVGRKGPLPPKRVATIGLDLLDPLAAAHAKNLVHGSLAPDAVLVPDRGPALLTGLGMAPTFLDEASRTWIDAMGTAGCLAPEQVELRGSSPASDLWALGATLYYAVEGAHAFESHEEAVDSPPREATHAKALAPVLERLLSKEPAWRPDLDELRSQLAEVAGVPLTAAQEALAERRRRRGRRDRRRHDDEAAGTEDADSEAEAESAEAGDDESAGGSAGAAGVDWDSAVVSPIRRRPAQPDETPWTDWSPGSSSDTSDVWLPDLEFEDDDVPPPPPPPPTPSPFDDPWARESDAADVRMAVPDLTENLDDQVGAGEDADPFTVVPFRFDNADQAVAETEAEADGPAEAEAEAPIAAADAPEGDEAPADRLALAEAADGAGEDADGKPSSRFRATPSWPPPEGRRSIWVIVLCSLVMLVMLALLVTNGRLGRPRTTAANRENNRPVLATDAALVPSDWIAYRHPNVNFTVSYPPRWTIREEGSLITIRDPATGTELRVDFRKPRGSDPEQMWTAQERDFSAKHPNDYKRLQLSPASYLGHVAALWEYTYLEGNLPVHAVDLGFLTDDYGFTMAFRAPAGTWDTMLAVFHGFLSSVRAPK